MCAQFIETTVPEGDYRPLSFFNPESYPLANGELYKLNATVGVIFVDDKVGTDGCRQDLEIDAGDEGVLVYHCEKIRLQKEVASGTNIPVGDPIYWDGVYGHPVTNVYASGLLWIAICVEDAADDDATVLCDLHGNQPLAQAAP